MAKKIQTVEDKLRSIYTLQLIDSNIDKIRTVRGELPLEVQDLEAEIEGLVLRKNNIENEISDLETSISDRKNMIIDAKEVIEKYKTQQGNVRNNREFDSLSKEIEFQELEIQLSEKKIKEFKFKIESKSEVFEEAKLKVDEKQQMLDQKNKELDEIISETENEEAILAEKSEKEAKKVDERLLRAYRRIRSGAKNGLAVVPVERGASGGSFISIPPQRQIEIASRKKIIYDEHSGRILIDAEMAEELNTSVSKMITKLLSK
ncbi:MAG: zinc ribbon domain-containing protein [Flavobacteriales bacterium]